MPSCGTWCAYSSPILTDRGLAVRPRALAQRGIEVMVQAVTRRRARAPDPVERPPTSSWPRRCHRGQAQRFGRPRSH